MDCTATNRQRAATLSCSACNKFVARCFFSNQQQAKASSRRRCIECINNDPVRIRAIQTTKANKLLYSKTKTATQELPSTGKLWKDELADAIVAVRDGNRGYSKFDRDCTFKDIRRWLILDHLPRLLRAIPTEYDITHVSMSTVSRQQRIRFAEAAHLQQRNAKMVFHGTPVRNLGPIMQHGLVVPGSADAPVKVQIANGSAYGVGIYGADHFETSVTYCQGSSRMLVCGVVGTKSLGVKMHHAITVITDAKLICPLVTLTWRAQGREYAAKPLFETLPFMQALCE